MLIRLAMYASDQIRQRCPTFGGQLVQ